MALYRNPATGEKWELSDMGDIRGAEEAGWEPVGVTPPKGADTMGAYSPPEVGPWEALWNAFKSKATGDISSGVGARGDAIERKVRGDQTPYRDAVTQELSRRSERDIAGTEQHPTASAVGGFAGDVAGLMGLASKGAPAATAAYTAGRDFIGNLLNSKPLDPKEAIASGIGAGAGQGITDPLFGAASRGLQRSSDINRVKSSEATGAKIGKATKNNMDEVADLGAWMRENNIGWTPNTINARSNAAKEAAGAEIATVYPQVQSELAAKYPGGIPASNQFQLVPVAQNIKSEIVDPLTRHHNPQLKPIGLDVGKESAEQYAAVAADHGTTAIPLDAAHGLRSQTGQGINWGDVGKRNYNLARKGVYHIEDEELRRAVQAASQDLGTDAAERAATASTNFHNARRVADLSEQGVQRNAFNAAPTDRMSFVLGFSRAADPLTGAAHGLGNALVNKSLRKYGRPALGIAEQLGSLGFKNVAPAVAASSAGNYFKYPLDPDEEK